MTKATVGTRESFRAGLEAGGISGGALQLLALSLLVPTHEFRVRLFTLLEGPRDFSLHAALAVLFLVIGSVALLYTRRVNRHALLGIAVASLANVVLVSIGWWRWLPEFREPLVQWSIALGTGIVTAVMLARIRATGLAEAGRRGDAA